MKLTALFVAIALFPVILTALVFRGYAEFWWLVFPGGAMLAFVGYKTWREGTQREKVMAAILIAMMVKEAIELLRVDKVWLW